MVMEPVIHSGRVEDIQVSAVSIGLELGAPVLRTAVQKLATEVA